MHERTPSLLLGLALLAGSCAATSAPQASSTAPVQATERPRNPVAGTAGVGDRYYPELGNGGYDVLHYHLELDVDMASRWLQGRATLRATAVEDLASFNLDLHALDVEDLHVDGAAADFDHEGHELVVTPAEPLLSGRAFEVVVEYSGVPEPVPEPSLPFLPGVGWFHSESGVYVLSECTGAASWFPCNDHPSDKATFSFEVLVDEPWVVAANGLLKEEVDLGERRRFRFEAKAPMATYLATVNIAQFEVTELEGFGDLPMPLYHPKDATEAELAAFARQGEMLTYFSELFGPYPFESCGGVISYERLPGALETQTLPVYGRGMSEPVVAHELAHQWFGDSVSPRRWQDMWLNEGFASYGEWLWLEKTRGEAAIEERARETYAMLRRVKVGSVSDPGLEALFGANVYVRGPFVLHWLRREVGDERFFGLLKKWVEVFGGGSATTEEFLGLLEMEVGGDVKEGFEAMLVEEVVPVVGEYEG